MFVPFLSNINHVAFVSLVEVTEKIIKKQQRRAFLMIAIKREIEGRLKFANLNHTI